MKQKQMALTLCQKISWSTVGGDFNEGKTLPLEISKNIALIMCDEMIQINECSKEYWRKVKSEIIKL